MQHSPSPRVRILLTISDLTGGGSERQFSLLARNLSRQRFDPHLCFWRPVFKHPYPEDCPVHLLDKRHARDVFRTIWRMARLIDQIQPDLVFSQLHYVNMVTGSALAFASHRPKWICRQVNDPRREMSGPFAVWARWALSRADRVIACSRGVQDQLTSHLNISPLRAVHLDNLADTATIERLANQPLPIERRRPFTIVHAGRLHAQKNQALLLKAISQLKDLDAELWLLGEGPLEKKLRALACRLRIEDRIRWLGFQTNPFPFFRRADCFVLSSRFEGLPNTLIEAMVCGTPCVSTKCPFGPDELIAHGETGLLVPPDDSDALASALRSLALDPTWARSLADRAKARAKTRFDLTRTVAAYEDLFLSQVREYSGISSCAALPE